MKTPDTVKIAKEIISHSMISWILKLEHYNLTKKENTKETVYQITTLKLKNSHAMFLKTTKIEKSVLCTNCSSPIHRKCSKLKLPELLEFTSSKYASWECTTCINQKFPFTSVDNNFLLKETFNSIFLCKCQTSTDYKQGDPKYVFDYKIKETSKELSYNNTIENNDQILDNFTLQPNFKVYQNHDFHKMTQNVNKQKDFSVFHTNICSLQGNFEKLQTLITNLEFKFSVIAISETWTSESKINICKPNNLEGYQTYCGIKGKTLKSGCGFYIRDDIRYKIRSDLNISYFDEDSEFQCFWIEILNDKKPNIIVGVYYRHPRKNSNNIYLDKLKETIEKVKSNNKTTVVAGDFNYDLLKYEYNKTANDFLNFMYSNFLQPCILESTRIASDNRPSLLDNIFINTYDKPILSGNIIDKISLTICQTLL